MPIATYRGHIRATPETVFAFVADAENNPRWPATCERPVGSTRRRPASAVVPASMGTGSSATGRSSPRSPCGTCPCAVTFQVIEAYKVRTAIWVEPDGDEAFRRSHRHHAADPRRVAWTRSRARLLQRATRHRESGDFRRLREALERENTGCFARAPLVA